MKKVKLDWSKIDKSKMPYWTYDSNPEHSTSVFSRKLWSNTLRIWEKEKNSPERIIDEIDNHRITWGSNVFDSFHDLTPEFIRLTCNVDIGDVVPDFPRPNTTYKQLFEALWRLSYHELWSAELAKNN